MPDYNRLFENFERLSPEEQEFEREALLRLLNPDLGEKPKRSDNQPEDTIEEDNPLLPEELPISTLARPGNLSTDSSTLNDRSIPVNTTG